MFRHMIDFDGFHCLRAFNEAPETLQKARGPRWRAMVTIHDSAWGLALKAPGSPHSVCIARQVLSRDNVDALYMGDRVDVYNMDVVHEHVLLDNQILVIN